MCLGYVSLKNQVSYEVHRSFLVLHAAPEMTVCATMSVCVCIAVCVLVKQRCSRCMCIKTPAYCMGGNVEFLCYKHETLL